MTRSRPSEDGFTLIEIMIVVLIIAVLVSIAMPSYQGFRISAQNRAAEGSLRTAELTARGILLDETAVPATADMLAELAGDEGSIAWVDGATSSTEAGEVSIQTTAANTELAMAAMSGSGRCYYMRLEVVGPTLRKAVEGAASCRAQDYLTGADEGW